MKKRIFAMFTGLCLCLSPLPSTAFAAQRTDLEEQLSQTGNQSVQTEEPLTEGKQEPQTPQDNETQPQAPQENKTQPQVPQDNETQPQVPQENEAPMENLQETQPFNLQEQKIEVPNAEDFTSNDQFQPYDRHYPQRNQFGDYTLRVPPLQGRLTFVPGRNDQVIGTLFAPGVNKTEGWKDATKRFNGTDDNQCFAAASSNLISWYVEQYQKQNPDKGTDLISDTETIFDYFRRGWKNDGADAKLALSWYFTGKLISGNDPNRYLTGQEAGGYLRNKIPNNQSSCWSNVSYHWDPTGEFAVYGGDEMDAAFPYVEELSGFSGTGDLATIEKFSQKIVRQLHYGPCAISIVKGFGNSGHAITLWGADYDIKTGLVTGIYVTDSDDKEYKMFRVTIMKDPNSDEIQMDKYPMHPGTNGGRYVKIRDAQMLYAPNVVIRNQEYTGPQAKIQQLLPDENPQGVTIQAAEIESPLEYGYAYENNVNQVKNWQTENHFVLEQPDQYYFFARVAAHDAYSAGGESEAAPYRLRTPSPDTSESVPALSLGAAALEPNKYVWYGTERGSDNQGQEEPILWRILKESPDSKNQAPLLLSEKLFCESTGKRIYFADAPFLNNYQGSSIQKWCTTFANDFFHSVERSGIFPTTQSDPKWDADGISFDVADSILQSDNVFLPSVQELATAFDTVEDRQRKYRGAYHSYWLRSPSKEGTGYAGYVKGQGNFGSSSVSMDHAVRPAFRLNKEQILYTTAVGQTNQQDGLVKLKNVMSSDFRLVMKDPSRGFQISDKNVIGQPGAVVSLFYTGAVTGQGEYISVILLDSNQQPIYYGRVAPAQTSEGTVDITLPLQLSKGIYTMKVWNEQYRGDRESGKASPFCDVELTVSSEVQKVPIKEVRITVPTPVKGQKPATAVLTQEGCVLGRTLWDPADEIFAPDTHYNVSIEVSADGNYQLTPSTAFFVNETSVPATTQDNLYTVTYTGFSKTEAESSGGDDSGSNSSNGSGSSSSGGDSGNTSDGSNSDGSGSSNSNGSGSSTSGGSSSSSSGGDSGSTSGGSSSSSSGGDSGSTSDGSSSSSSGGGGNSSSGGGGSSSSGGGGNSSSGGGGSSSSGGGGSSSSGGGGNSGSGGGGNSKAPEATPKVEEDKTGTTVRPDGTKVDVSIAANGDKTVVETKKDGSVTISTTTAKGSTAKTEADPQGHTKTEIVISQKEQQESQAANKPVALPIPAQKPSNTPSERPVIQIQTQSEKDAVITVPVSHMTPSTTVILLHPDGKETLVCKCTNQKDGITLSVQNGAVLKLADHHKEFSDTKDHWAKDSIAFVTSHQLYTGTSQTKFSPNDPMTRGMLAVVLHNLENNPTGSGNAIFQDVPENQWYTKAIQWATQQEIVSGYGNGRFGPNDKINREQLVVMLYRYAQEPAHNGEKLNFQDADKISPYAQDAMQWAVEKGIVSGVGNHMLNPKGTATRAQVSAMLVKLLQQMW